MITPNRQTLSFSIKHTISTVGACTVLLGALALFSPASAQTAVLSYNFNDAAGTTAANSGSVGSIDNLTLESGSDVATDYLSPYSTGGIVGPDGTGSLNLTSSSGMGSLASSPGPFAASNTAGSVFTNSQSFTLSGWYNTSVTSSWASGRLIQASNFIFDGSNANNLILQVGSTTYQSNTGGSGSSFSTTVANQWTFFAVTYNQAASTTDQVVFYQGVEASNGSLSSLLSYTVPVTVSATLSGSGFSIGSNTGASASATTGSNLRPFEGSFDDINAYVSTTDNSGALTTSQINALYQAQAVPEPSVILSLALGLFVLGWIGLRRRRPIVTAV